jgi:hypothetical protein
MAITLSLCFLCSFLIFSFVCKHAISRLDRLLYDQVINEGQGWESPREPYEVKAWWELILVSVYMFLSPSLFVFNCKL